MRICVVNQTSIPDVTVQHVIRAINAQLVDLAYHWSVVAQLRLEGYQSLTNMDLRELRGDALIYLSADIEETMLGFHTANAGGIPWGVVFVGDEVEPWSVTLSHEVLELAVDPHCNRFAMGPHPSFGHSVFHWYELCDAVQANQYEIGGVLVSDFVLPPYFTPGEERGMRKSYLGAEIKSFGIDYGGYIGFYDPDDLQTHTFANDQRGKEAAIRKASDGERDYTEIARLQQVLSRPFDEQPEFDSYAQPAPDWAANLEVSCSS